MATWAKLNSKKIVTDVVVVADDKPEPKKWLKSRLGGDWIQISGKAGIGFSYDSENKIFIPPQPFESWILNSDTFTWEAPTPRPEDQKEYYWDEEITGWVASGEN